MKKIIFLQLTKTITLIHIPPSAQLQVTTQRVLQRSRQMLIEYTVQIVIIGAQIAFQLRAEPRVRVVDAPCIVVALPELNWTHV